jgi:REP element-mobilizing transposase RayT
MPSNKVRQRPLVIPSHLNHLKTLINTNPHHTPPSPMRSFKRSDARMASTTNAHTKTRLRPPIIIRRYVRPPIR